MPHSSSLQQQSTSFLICDADPLHVQVVTLPPEFDDLCDQQQLILNDGLARGLAAKQTGPGQTPPHLGMDLFHTYTWHGGSRYPMMSENLMSMLDDGLTADAGAVEAAYAKQKQLRAALSGVMDALGCDAFLTPTGVDVAPIGRHTGNAIFCTPWSFLGTPSAAVPGFKEKETGMPVGVQFNGRHGDDVTVLALAKWLHGYANLTRPSPPGPHSQPAPGTYPPPPKL